MRIFLARIKILIRRKDIIFWAFFFPLILGTVFKLCFGNLTYTAVLDTAIMNVVVEDEYKLQDEFLESASLAMIDEDKPLFNIKYIDTLEEAKTMLSSNEISNYIYFDDNYQVTFKNNSLESSVINSFIEQYARIDIAIQTYCTQALQRSEVPNNAVIQAIIVDMTSQMSYIENTTPKQEGDSIIIYFYALISMTCMFASFWGTEIIRETRADTSEIGIRNAIAPTHKLRTILTYFFAALAIQVVSNVILIGYLNFVLGISFGSSTVLILLTMFIGAISGIALGMIIACFIKSKGDTLTAVANAISLILSAMAGLMSVALKRFIDTQLPLLNRINPANLITEGLHCLYYFDTYERFWINIATLSAVSIIMIAVVYIKMRGAKYESI